ARQLAVRFPDENAKLTSPRLMPLQEELVGSHRATLLILLGAVGLVLLLVCANLASLLIARTTGRRRELCIRAALGAPRWQLLRRLFAESLLLAMLGGALGLLLAIWGIDALRTLSAHLPRLTEIHVDARMFGFAAALSIGAGLLFGTLPALHAARAGAE